MSPWCRHARHADCDDPACDCPCHLQHLDDTVAMIERCARHQVDVAVIVPSEVASRVDEVLPMGRLYHAPSDEGRADHVPLIDEDGP